MIFIDKTHEDIYNDLCGCMKYLDNYHRPVAYLIALDSVLREHIDEIFDFENDKIIRDVLNKPWQTNTSKKASRLAFNLWDGYCYEKGINEYGNEVDMYNYYTPAYIFDTEYFPYYFEAVRLAFDYVFFSLTNMEK